MAIAAIGRTQSRALRLEADDWARDSRARQLRKIALLSSTAFLVLLADAMLNSRAFFDAWGLRQAQKIDWPVAEDVFTVVNALTSSQGAMIAWVAAVVAMIALRWWVPVIALSILPFGALVNEGFGMVTAHERPEGAEFVRTVATDAASFPSGHVMGAVMLYGLLFVVAGRFRDARVSFVVRAASLAIIVLVGISRMWEGAHWPSDVLGAYALGALVLSGILAVYFAVDSAWGDLPLVRRGRIPHDVTRKHAHALTSVVMFDDDSVAKIYGPGLLPRLMYFIAFQAPFPYIANRAALEAAVARRNLARLLTYYWYGSPRVARATGVEEVGLSLALRSEFVRGSAPADRKAAKAWLTSVRQNFERAGLPTWQIDPRQPRAVDNVLEVAPGDYRIVDLESGLVTPIASPRVIARGIRRGMFPLFDGVYFDITRSYVARQAESIRDVLGEERYGELLATVDEAEARQHAWQDAEPRLIGRFLGGFWSGWNYRAWPGRFARITARGQEKANAWMQRAVDAWASEGRVTPAEASIMRGQIESAEMRAAMPHLGAHGVISIFLRFPFGSIARPAWTLSALLVDTTRLLLRRISLAQWKQSWSMHSPIVVALSVIPGFGVFAYLAAKPVRKNRLLVRAVLDSLCMKVPGRLYERSGARRVLARRQGLRALPNDPGRCPELEAERAAA